VTWFASATNQAAAVAAHVESIVLVEIALGSGTLYMHTRTGNLSWNSQTWLGVGKLGEIGEVRDDAELRPAGLRLILSGIDSALVASAVTEDYRGRAVIVRQGFLNVSTFVMVADPEVVFKGVIDTMTVEHGQNSGSISLSCENELARWARPRAIYYTHESQQLLYAGDNGFDQVPHIQQKPIDCSQRTVWGAGSGYSGGGGVRGVRTQPR